MKTRELIAALQEADPSGETDVCVGNAPIYYVEQLPAYYDGPLGQLVQDKSVTHCCNITGYKFTTEGSKVKIVAMDLDDCLCDDPELPVDVSGVSNAESRERIVAHADAYRQKIRDINARLDAERAAKLAPETPGRVPIVNSSGNVIGHTRPLDLSQYVAGGGYEPTEEIEEG